MNDKHFDDILKNSMETTRPIAFDESAWSRLEQEYPSNTANWKTWLKFIPFAIGIISLLGWNIYLQQQINYMQEHPNVIVKTEDAPQKEIIYRVDTIYQITESNITKEAVEQYIKQYFNVDLSRTEDNSLITSKNSYLKPDYLITSNPNNRFSGSYNPNTLKSSFITPSQNSNSFTSNFDDPNVSNLNIKNNSNENVLDSTLGTLPIDSVHQKVFANSNAEDTKNIRNPLFSDNSISAVEENSMKNTQDAAAEEENTKEHTLTALENIAIEELYYYQSLDISDAINVAALYSPAVAIKPNLREKFQFNEFSLGLGNSTVISNYGMFGAMSGFGLVNYTVGLHAGAYILPNISIEAELNYLHHNSILGLSSNLTDSDRLDFIYPNPYTSPDPSSIPATSNLEMIHLEYKSVQLSLGLKRIWFKDEHIRPFGEIGWLPSKGTSGYMDYNYTQIENNSVFSTSIGFPLVEDFKHEWDFSTVYFGGGLSFSLIKSKIDLDLGLRYNLALDGANYQNPNAFGTFGSLTYNF